MGMEEAGLMTFLSGTVAIVVMNLTCGMFSSWLAEAKGYSGFAWLFLGFFFGPFALVTMVGAPDKTTEKRP